MSSSSRLRRIRGDDCVHLALWFRMGVADAILAILYQVSILNFYAFGRLIILGELIQ